MRQADSAHVFKIAKCPVILESGWNEASKVGAHDSGALSQKPHLPKAFRSEGSDLKCRGSD